MRMSTPGFTAAQVMNFPTLAGGLNLRDLGYLVDGDESPNVKNLIWKNGLLQSRDGQTQIALPTVQDGETAVAEVGYTCFDSLFHGYAFFHIGDTIQCLSMPVDETSESTPRYTVLKHGVPGNRGTFFRYQDYLFYKNRGGFYQISYSSVPTLDIPFAVDDVVSIAERVENAPITVINASPTNGSGTLYQPENRISALKTVRYTAEDGVADYHLPVQYIDGVLQVKVNGVVLNPGSQYTVNTTTGVVHFNTAPDPGNPIVNNTVHITYAKANEAAMQSVMNCEYAVVAGGDTNLCILLGGCDKQPNAVFWNSNDELAMQPYYFPIPCYNLVGDTEDPVTGFGRQYNDTIVFKEHSVGKLAYSIDSIDGRNTISFGYLSVNAKLGCDLPWTIQQVENNVVFCNSYVGACIVLSSSAAYENNIQELSQKIKDDGSASGTDINGLLRDIRESTSDVVSFDDDERYWLCANGKVYVWDYGVSTYAKPSWFYWDNISPAALLRDDSRATYHMNALGRLTKFDRSFSDYGQAIRKEYQFPTLHFGTYDRLKDVLYILLSIRSDTDSTIAVRYDTDYETRYDLTPVVSRAAEVSAAQGRRYVKVAKRKPGCRHVRQFGLTLSNNTAGEDLALVSAQVFYRFVGKER